MIDYSKTHFVVNMATDKVELSSDEAGCFIWVENKLTEGMSRQDKAEFIATGFDLIDCGYTILAIL
jgi:hypothetical protein